MSLFPSSSTRLVRDLLLRAPVLSHLASDKVRTSLRQRRISLGLNRHQVQGVGSSPVKRNSLPPWQSSLPQKSLLLIILLLLCTRLEAQETVVQFQTFPAM